MIKLLALVRRRTDLTPEEFARYWTTVHAPLAEAQGPRGYVIDIRTSAQPDGAIDDLDSVAEIWWDDHDHMTRGLTSEAGRIAAADVSNFAAEVRFVVVEPNTIVTPPA